MYSGEELTAGRESSFSAASDIEFFQDSQIIHQDIHQSEFVAKANESVQASGMNGHTVRFFRKEFLEFTSVFTKIPDFNRLVGGTSGKNRLSNAHIEAENTARMERL